MTKKEYEKKTKNLNAPKYEKLTKKQKDFYDFDFTGQKENKKLKQQLDFLIKKLAQSCDCIVPMDRCKGSKIEDCEKCIRNYVERLGKIK